MRIILLLLFLLFSKLTALEVLFEVKEPYIYKKDGMITGYTLSNVLKVLKAAKIEYTFKEKTLSEQIKELKANQKKVCAIIWNKNEAYKKFAKLTKPIYQDKTYGIITQRRYKFEPKTDIAELIKDRSYRVLVKKDFSYPKELTNVLNQLPKKVVNTSKDYNIVTLIAKKKGDFAFIPYDDAKLFIQKHKYRSRIKFVELSGLNMGQSQYLACSLRVNDSTVQKINSHLK